ncbi:MAG: alanine--tRNA ligase, partial [Candidatus Raymondbacteria bacterium RifOxyB12_full_50_8]
HIRALIFAIADGALPSNLGRGYVLRRLLRRAYRFGRKLGFHGPFLHTLVPTVVSIMGDAYPELKERSDFVQKILLSEEQSFEKTLDKGLLLFEEIAKKAASKVVAGSDVFMLYDTYGFPPDLTAQLAEEAGLSIDQPGFEKEMEAQRERARSASKFKDMAKEGGVWTAVSEGPGSLFAGYDLLSCDTPVRKVRKTKEGYDFVFEKTPFYPEGGGQCADSGIATFEEGVIEIYDTRKEGEDIVHKARCEGEIDFSRSTTANLQVDADRRADIRRNHTATHIIQTALRQAVGDHVKQSGSSVTPDRFRFDFTHFQALSDSEIAAVEKAANSAVLADLPVVTEVTSPEEAQAKGALAFFNEKYGNKVRMVSIPGTSVELCGGTHAARTGEIGYIRILSESSVSTGIRRIEAVTGRAFGDLFRAEAAAMRSLSLSFKTPFIKVLDRIAEMGERMRGLEKELAQVKQQQALKELDTFLAQAIEVKGIRVVRARLDNADKDTFALFCDALAAKAGSAVTAAIAASEGKVMVFAAVSDDLVASRKLNAGAIVNKIAVIVGGKGGGKPNRAQAGGKDAVKVPEAYAAIGPIVESMA